MSKHFPFQCPFSFFFVNIMWQLRICDIACDFSWLCPLALSCGELIWIFRWRIGIWCYCFYVLRISTVWREVRWGLVAWNIRNAVLHSLDNMERKCSTLQMGGRSIRVFGRWLSGWVARCWSGPCESDNLLAPVREKMRVSSSLMIWDAHKCKLSKASEFDEFHS